MGRGIEELVRVSVVLIGCAFLILIGLAKTLMAIGALIFGED